MPERRDTANGKACSLTYKRRIRLAQRLARKSRGLVDIHAVVACRDEELGGVAGGAAKDHRFGDLRHIRPQRIRSFLRRAGGDGHFDDLDIKPAHARVRRHPLETFAHSAA